MGERVPPVGGGPWRGRLGEVAKQGERAVLAPAGDRAELHRRQVLRLVHHDVSIARQPVDEPGRLVDENGVRRRPLRRLDRPRWTVPAQRRLLLSVSTPVGRPREHGRVGQKREDELLSGHLGPHRSRNVRTCGSRPIRRSQASGGDSPRRASACRCSSATVRARTRSRPVAYGGCSRRTSSTIRRNASAEIRQRHAPSETTSPSSGRPMRAASARASTVANRASCFSDGHLDRILRRGPAPGP